MAEILFLTNNDNAKGLYDWICTKTSAEYFSEKLTLDILKEKKPKFVVSYNYKYIVPADCIDYMQKRIINMHISFLPWNRGASPNIWSFIEDTPKGVTIHEMSPGLDEGDIIFQREVEIDSTDTLSSSYKKLNSAIVELFKEHWDELYSGNYIAKKQIEKGSYHTLKDLHEFESKVEFEWSDLITNFLNRVAEKRTKGILE